jgi:hypothetical protein
MVRLPTICGATSGFISWSFTTNLMGSLAQATAAKAQMRRAALKITNHFLFFIGSNLLQILLPKK